jgi:integrase
MARTLQDRKLDTRSARLKLKKCREPYWRSISEGMAVGYRKGTKGGTWVAKQYTPEQGRRYKALGTADDVMDSDGVQIFSFAQAQNAAHQWFKDLALDNAGDVTAGVYTVKDAMADYLAEYKRRGGKGVAETVSVINAHILPTLGGIALTKLTSRKLKAWRDEVAERPAKLRSRRETAPRFREADNTPDAVRRRQSTANRILTVLKAALNYSQQEHRVATRAAWEAVKPFREVDTAKIRFLTDAEALRLVDAAPIDLRAIVSAALLTGARLGELAALQVRDYSREAKSIHIVRSKSGKPRHIALSDEGCRFFESAVASKPIDALIFTRISGGPWKRAHQFRPMREACTAANIAPPVSFHILRHTYASRLAMRGVPMGVIAVQLGHADTRMTEKHYAHLAPSYIAETVRTFFGELGII